MKRRKERGFTTRAVHGEGDETHPFGATTPPIVHSASYAYETAAELEEIFAGRQFGYIYSRLANPTVTALEKRICALEGGIGAVACASGMAAITVAVASIARRGDEVIAGNSLFGGTYALLGRTLGRFGIRTRFVETTRIDEYRNALTDKTKMIFVETMGNPKLDVADIGAISAVARGAGVPLLVDNTVTSPYLFRPKERGADIVIHSSTKYLNGHGNSIGGIIVDIGTFPWNPSRYADFAPYLERFGGMAYLAKIRTEVHRDFGPCLSPLSAFLTLTGVETLGLRMERQCANALALARFLSGHENVAWVNYPGLAGHRQHALAASQFGGRFAALLTFGLGGRDRAFALIDALEMSKNLANLGDAKTLVIHPASTICHDFDPEEKREMGVTEDMVRVSVGIEDGEDIIADFAQALDRSGTRG